MLSLMRLPLAIAAVLSLSLTLCISIMRAMPYEAQAMQASFIPPADCTLPCWQYIRPGVTTAEELFALLDQNAWADTVQADPFSIRWQWSETRPPLVDPGVPAAALVVQGEVQNLTLASTAQMGDFFLTMGRPRWISTAHSRRQAEIVLTYPAEGLTLALSLPCPVTRQAFWQAQPTVRLNKIAPLSRDFIDSLMNQSFAC